MLIMEVEKIIGNCVVHKDRICIHALQSILHYAVALENGVDPVKLGLSKESGCAY